MVTSTIPPIPPDPAEHTAQHSTELAAPADELYGLVADALAGPVVFPATVQVEYLHHAADREHIRIWAADDDDGLRCWSSHRERDPAARTVAFRQDVPWPPLSLMRGEWRFTPLGPDRTRVTLAHAYATATTDPADLARLESLLDRVSNGQLAALRRFSGPGRPTRRSLDEEAELACPADRAYAAVRDAEAWPTLLPDLMRVRLANCQDEARVFHVSARTGGGRIHETRLVQVCRASSGHFHIAFKDLRPIAPLVSHSGWWRIEPTHTGCRVRVRHEIATTAGAGTGPDAPRTSGRPVSVIIPEPARIA